MKSLSKALLGLAVLSAAFLPPLAKAEPGRCVPQALLIAKAQDERPSTIVMAQYDGSQAAAILAALNEFVTQDVPAADEITVLYSDKTHGVLLIGAESGCTRWRSVFSLEAYEQVLRKAIGIEV